MTTDAPTPRERRPIDPPLETVSGVGLTRDLIRCPFCQTAVWAYAWSRAGSGKRCPCGALLCATTALAPQPKVRRRHAKAPKEARP
jgi:hypothetical protein